MDELVTLKTSIQTESRSITVVDMADDALQVDETKGWLYHPTYPEHWDRRSLYSLASWVNGLAFRDIQFSSNGVPVIKIAEIKYGISGQTKFTEQTFDESVQIRPGDLLFSWSGQPETSIDAFWWQGPEGWLNQHVFRVTPGELVDSTFFFYLLRYLKPNFIGIARNKQTTGLGHVTKRDIQTMEAAFPSLSEQRAIAHILGTLDDKIELNRRMNQTLEEIARALFRSWFVDFAPVRAKAEGRQPAGMDAATAALFPSEFEQTEYGEVPKGWGIGTVADLAHIARNSINPAATPDEIFDHYSIPAFDDGQRAVREPGSNIKSNKTLVEWTAVLISKLNPRIPRVWLPDISSGHRSICSTEFLVVVPDDPSSRAFIYSLLTSESFTHRFASLVTGTTGSHQRVSPASLLAIGAVIPPKTAIERYGEVVKPLLERIATNQQESLSLAQLRDILLPKLLSGEVRVPESGMVLASAAGS